MPQALNEKEVESAVRELPGWRSEGDALVKELRFKDFSQAFAFLTRLALVAEKSGHHPDFHSSYSKVRLELRSHDAGGVTQRDIDMAEAVEKLLSSPPTPQQT
ncbi:MAG TPA: 4a-hydroxytetrahydrobiopterin dehydratase [Trueperaceae bacterium]|nr:4a-hydroxytetrahydrobiopterin dehydratase [Trueperaceae bacterium]